MKNFLFVGKITLLAILGILFFLSLVMFPVLIGSNDNETSVIGYSYLAIFLVSSIAISLLLKKEIKA